jgi:hypothetical protein
MHDIITTVPARPNWIVSLDHLQAYETKCGVPLLLQLVSKLLQVIVSVSRSFTSKALFCSCSKVS